MHVRSRADGGNGKGKNIQTAFETAVNFVREAVEHTLGIGEGHGPTNHFAFKRNSLQTR